MSHFSGVKSRIVICGLLLILGLINPVSGNTVDLFLGFFIFGFAAGIAIPSWVLALGLAVATGTIGGNPLTILGAVVGWVLAQVLVKFRLVGKVSLLVLVVTFLVTSFATNRELVAYLSRDLPLYTYNNDPGVLYKTYLLLSGDMNYYDAYRTAQLGRFEQPLVPGDIWGWRLPTIFFLWRLLPGTSGISIYILYLALAACVLYVAYLIAVRYLGSRLGILAPYLLFPYLHFGARDQMFLETEWWGVFLFIIGLFFLIGGRYFWAIVFLSLTVLVREVYVLPLVLMFTFALIKRRGMLAVFAIPLSAFGVLYLFHIIWTSYYIDAWGTLKSARVLESGWFFVQQTLAFASWEYLFFNFRPFLIFLVLAAFGLISLYMRRSKEEAIIWALAALSFPLSFLRFGTVPYNDYWGIIYVPLVLILAPLALLAFGGGEQSKK